MEINWTQIGREKFDDIVEALLRRMNLRADEFRVYNGRGGDGGRDIAVRMDGKVTIYQLKYFPEGFSSTWGQRRSQILKSYKAAQKHNPNEWCLVVPCNLTQSEQDYVFGLRPKNKRKPKIYWLGEAELNDELAQRSDIVSYFNRDESLEKARIYNREIDLLAAGSRDVFERVRALGGVVDDVDLNWTLDFARHGDSIVQMIRPKHPWAQEVSPINVTFVANFDADDIELKESYERVTGYGTSETIQFPVSQFEILGPPLVAHVGQDAVVRMGADAPDSAASQPFQMTFTDGDERPLGSHVGVAVRGGQAHLGRSIETTFYKALRFTFLIPHDTEQVGKVQVSVDLAGAEPTTVLRVRSLLDAVHNASKVQMKIAGKDFVSADLSRTASPLSGDEDRADWDRYCSLADDLDIVQRHCGVFFPMPDEVSGRSRLFARAARLLIDGQCVAVPGHERLTAVMNGNDGPEIREFLGGKGIILLDQESFGFEIFGQRLILGHARTYGTNSVVENGSEAIAALDAEGAREFKIRLRPGEAHSYWTFLVDASEHDGWPRPVGWALPDFPDPPDAAGPSEPGGDVEA